MIDRPVPAKIILTLSGKKVTGIEFIGLSGTLYRQNLIYSEPRELRWVKNTLELMVVFRDNISYKNWQKNKEIKSYWSVKFKDFLTENPTTFKERDLVIELDDVRNCVCSKSDYYILQGRTFRFIDELTCNKCLGQISYSKVPLEIKLEDWQNKYERFYLNWLESGMFEKEAYKELTNYTKGKLNLEGEKIRKQLSDYFQIPVYIQYFFDESISTASCLKCGDQGVESGLNQPDRVCKTCHTIFGYKGNLT